MVIIKTFFIPLAGGEDVQNELNELLRHHHLYSLTRHFVEGDEPGWAIVVQVSGFKNSGTMNTGGGGKASGKSNSGSGGNGQIDYREVLSAEDFEVYARLREWRNRLSDKTGDARYNIVRNGTLAAIAQKRCTTLAGLKEIPDFGEQRCRKYGESLLALLAGKSVDEVLEPSESPDQMEMPDMIPKPEDEKDQ